jgi:hypothetical protein
MTSDDVLPVETKMDGAPAAPKMLWVATDMFFPGLSIPLLVPVQLLIHATAFSPASEARSLGADYRLPGRWLSARLN